LEPISGLIPMLNIQLGEIIFGGIGSGFYSILLFVFLSIFICGLIIGRTPEYLGKKIETKEMKLLLFGILIFFFLILTFSAISSVLPIAKESIKNKGPHGLSEILYTYSTSVANNGSSFSGLNANTLWYNLSTGFCMLLGRYELIIFILALSGSLAIKKKVMSEGAFPISGVIFISVLFITILVIGVMTFLPAIIMGPILEKFYLIQKTFF
jgi:K+-transporting ATPase ATPase A chain